MYAKNNITEIELGENCHLYRNSVDIFGRYLAGWSRFC